MADTNPTGTPLSAMPQQTMPAMTSPTAGLMNHPVVQNAIQNPQVQAIASQHPAKGGVGHPAVVANQIAQHPAVQAAAAHPAVQQAVAMNPAKGAAGTTMPAIGQSFRPTSIGGIGQFRIPAR